MVIIIVSFIKSCASIETVIRQCSTSLSGMKEKLFRVNVILKVLFNKLSGG